MNEHREAPEIPEDLRQLHLNAIETCNRLEANPTSIKTVDPVIAFRVKAMIERIAAHAAEIAALKKELTAAQEQLVMAHEEMSTVNQLTVENAALKAEVARLSVPVTDDELLAVIPKLSRYVSERLLITRWKDGIDIEEPNSNARELVNAIIAARTTPAKEQP